MASKASGKMARACFFQFWSLFAAFLNGKLAARVEGTVVSG
jgi:hypothetical protein